MEQMTFLLLLIICVQIPEGLIWNSSTASNSVCVGNSIYLAWVYTLDSSEILSVTSWTKSDGAGGLIVLADDFLGFTPAAGYVGRLTRIGNAGIQISNAATSDSGTYIVYVTLTSGLIHSVNATVYVYEIANSSCIPNCDSSLKCQIPQACPVKNYVDSFWTVDGVKYINEFTCFLNNYGKTYSACAEGVAVTACYSRPSLCTQGTCSGGPINSINLGSFTSILGVDLHQTAPNITCNATCNPPCAYRWYQNGTFYINGATLSLGVVEKTTRGNYRCEAYTSVLGLNLSSSISVNITVYYAPEVLLQPAVLTRPNVYILKLGQTNVGLTCVVIDANPPAQQFIWTKDGHEILTQTSPTFTIAMVTKDTIGRWGCKGVNSKGNPLESTLDVDVHYGPAITILSNKAKVEGEQLNVTCMVDSRPDTSSISWTKSQNNTFAQNRALMYIAHLNRADKGTYECTAVNTIQPTGEAVGEIITVKSNYTLDVTYGAGIVNLSVQGDTTVDENSSAVLQCRVDSNPPSTITWMRQNNITILKTESGVSQSVYRIESAECLSMGNYTCSAYNGIWTPAKETIPFFVRCHPRTDFQLTLETKIYRKRHEGVILRYTVISYPFPIFNWTFLGNGNDIRGLPVSASQHDDGQQSELWLTSLGINDFGTYSVVADNSLYPSAREVYHIIPADVPEIPTNVMIVEITQSSFNVQWLAGNNGGPQQTFHIIASAGILIRSVSAADPGYKKIGTAVLEGLLPKTEYNIYMLASNSIGSSNMTEAIMAKTLEVPGTTNGTSIAGIAGGVSVGIVVILIVSIGIFLWRRHRPPITNDQGFKLESDINAYIRPADSDVYEQLHSYANRDIQVYSSLKWKSEIKD